MRIRVYATVRAIIGEPVIDFPVDSGDTALRLAQKLVERWPELNEILLDEGHLSRRAHVFLDGRSARHLPDGEDSVIEEHHEVDVFPAVAGG